MAESSACSPNIVCAGGCFSCHVPVKARDFVFTRYAPCRPPHPQSSQQTAPQPLQPQQLNRGHVRNYCFVYVSQQQTRTFRSRFLTSEHYAIAAYSAPLFPLLDIRSTSRMLR